MIVFCLCFRSFYGGNGTDQRRHAHVLECSTHRFDNKNGKLATRASTWPYDIAQYGKPMSPSATPCYHTLAIVSQTHHFGSCGTFRHELGKFSGNARFACHHEFRVRSTHQPLPIKHGVVRRGRKRSETNPLFVLTYQWYY